MGKFNDAFSMSKCNYNYIVTNGVFCTAGSFENTKYVILQCENQFYAHVCILWWLNCVDKEKINDAFSMSKCN